MRLQSFAKQLVSVSEDQLLSCPSCEHQYLEQHHVEVFNGDKSVEVSHDLATRKSEPVGESKHPVIDGAGVSIHFECGCCEAKPILDMYFHKGHTRIGWRNHRWGI